MNVFVYTLARGRTSKTPDLSSEKLVVEDNIGEGIHIHWRNIRLEMTIEDFEIFAEEIRKSLVEIENGDH